MTSQIFANIYLNEFDRFVRHHIKPLGYLRYGDDFVLFMNTKEQTLQAQAQATRWLLTELRLTVHSKNNVVVKVTQGLRFLGHNIYPTSSTSVDKAMIHRMQNNLNSKNIGTYRSMHVPVRRSKHLQWLLLEKIASRD